MTKSTSSSKKVAKPRVATAKKVAKKTTKKPGAAKTTVAKKATKSATKKNASTKKAHAKRAVNKKRPVVEAPNDKSFWTTDGQILNTIVALNEALNIMHDTVYEYHVNQDRHDFADWVETVLEDPECAMALRKAKTPKAARTVVVRHLKFYQI